MRGFNFVLIVDVIDEFWFLLTVFTRAVIWDGELELKESLYEGDKTKEIKGI